MKNLLLFLCTGNYYRSRFAEALFNSRARQAGLDWWSLSRGLAVGHNPAERGPLSSWVVLGLARRGLDPGGLRQPMQLAGSDLMAADRVIALHEAEHRPLLQRLDPAAAADAEYWHVRDVPPSASYDPLAEIERGIGELLVRLRGFPIGVTLHGTQPYPGQLALK